MSSHSATRSDREVSAWEFSRGSCLYFLHCGVAYFWAWTATHLGNCTPIFCNFGIAPNKAGFGGAFFRKAWRQSTRFRVRSLPPWRPDKTALMGPKSAPSTPRRISRSRRLRWWFQPVASKGQETEIAPRQRQRGKAALSQGQQRQGGA